MKPNLTNICPEVNITCCATNFSQDVLTWYFDNTPVADYVFNTGDNYPRPAEILLVDNEDFGVEVWIANASRATGNAVNFLSTLSIRNISMLQEAGVSRISCGSFSDRSRHADVVYNSSLGEIEKKLQNVWTCTNSNNKRVYYISAWL